MRKALVVAAGAGALVATSQKPAAGIDPQTPIPVATPADTSGPDPAHRPARRTTFGWAIWSVAREILSHRPRQRLTRPATAAVKY